MIGYEQDVRVQNNADLSEIKKDENVDINDAKVKKKNIAEIAANGMTNEENIIHGTTKCAKAKSDNQYLKENDLVTMLTDNKKMFNLKKQDVMQFFDVIYPMLYVKYDTCTTENPTEISNCPSSQLSTLLPRYCGPVDDNFKLESLQEHMLLDIVFDKMALKKQIPIYKLDYRLKIDMGNIVQYSDHVSEAQQEHGLFENNICNSIHRKDACNELPCVASMKPDSVSSFIYRIKLAVASKGNERPKEIQVYNNLLVYKDAEPMDTALENCKSLLFKKVCSLEEDEKSSNRNRPCYLMRDGMNGPEVSFQVFDSKYNLGLDERHIAMVCRAKGKSKPAEMHVAFTREFLHTVPEFKQRFQDEYTNLLTKLADTDVMYVPLFFDPSKACVRAVNWFWGAWRNTSFNVLNTMWVHTSESRSGKKGKPVQCPINFVEVYLAKINSITDLRVFKHIGDNLMRKRLEWLHRNYPTNEIVVWHKNKILLKELLDINVTVPKPFVQCGYVSTHRPNLQVMTDAVVDLFVDEREKNKFQGISPSDAMPPNKVQTLNVHEEHSRAPKNACVLHQDIQDTNDANQLTIPVDNDTLQEKTQLGAAKRKYEDLSDKCKATMEELAYNFELEKEILLKRQKMELEILDIRATRQTAWHEKLAEQYANMANEIFM